MQSIILYNLKETQIPMDCRIVVFPDDGSGAELFKVYDDGRLWNSYHGFCDYKARGFLSINDYLISGLFFEFALMPEDYVFYSE